MGRGGHGRGRGGWSGEPATPAGTVIRKWDVTNIVQNRDEQNLRELEVLRILLFFFLNTCGVLV